MDVLSDARESEFYFAVIMRGNGGYGIMRLPEVRMGSSVGSPISRGSSAGR